MPLAPAPLAKTRLFVPLVALATGVLFLSSERTVHAADIVELAPIPGFPAPDFLSAKLAYKMIGYRFDRDLRRIGG